MRAITITEGHLDAALALPGWSCVLCVVAQAMPRKPITCGIGCALLASAFMVEWDDRRVDALMHLFDWGKGPTSADKWGPPPADWEARCRAMLPLTFDVYGLS